MFKSIRNKTRLYFKTKIQVRFEPIIKPAFLFLNIVLPPKLYAEKYLFFSK